MTRKIRPIRVEGNLAYVPLTQGRVAIIDAADVHLVEGFNWYAMKNRNTFYAQRTDRSGTKQRTVLMHRVIMGEPDGLDVDHEGGNGLNNRREKLRVATKSQNQHNQRKSRANTSGLKGVYWDKSQGKWRAQIQLGGKKKHLGRFDTPEQAYADYCAASAKYHGEFGRTK